MDLYTLRFRVGGLSIADAAHLLRVDRRTFERWENGIARIPFAAFALLSILCGDLWPLGETWKGWKCRGGSLWSPSNQEITPSDLQALIFQRENGMLYCLGEPHRAECPTRQTISLKSVA